MPNKKNSSKPTWVPFNTWEAQQKALIKAKLEATKAQEEAKEKAQKEAMMKIHDWGTPSGRHNCFKTPKTFLTMGAVENVQVLSGKCMKLSKISENS